MLSKSHHKPGASSAHKKKKNTKQHKPHTAKQQPLSTQTKHRAPAMTTAPKSSITTITTSSTTSHLLINKKRKPHHFTTAQLHHATFTDRLIGLTDPNKPFIPTELRTNPLITPSTLPYQCPDFSKIKFEHFEPAIRFGMKKHKQEIDAIINNPAPATFENTIQALEYAGEIFSRSHGVFANLSYSDSNDQMMELEDTLSPLLSDHSDDIYLDEGLFKRVAAVYDNYKKNPALFKQMHEDVRLLEVTYQGFVLSGARLNDADKAKMREYNKKLSVLENKFSQNLLKTEENTFLTIDNLDDLEGLGEDEIAVAKALAIEKGVATEEQQKDPKTTKYVLNLVNTSRNPALTSLANREVRKKLFNLSTTRALEGEHGNAEIIYEILVLRAKVAGLLGFKNYSEYKLVDEMAKNPAKALQLLNSLVPGVLASVKNEKQLLEEEMLQDEKLLATVGGDKTKIKLESHDWEYYAEKVRSRKFNVDPDVLKEYLSYENVLNGALIDTMKELYGITFTERNDIPTYHADVKVWELKNEDGSDVGLFLGDYFKRSGKMGGAWSTSYVSKRKLPTTTPSVVVNVMNIPKAATNGDDKNKKPTLVPFTDVSTILHEVSHGTHALFSTSKYDSLGSTNTATDWVEVPSTFAEDFSYFPHILERYAKHYETGATIDKALLQRVIQSTKFNLGYETFEYLASALIDLKWHQMTEQELEQVFAKYPTKAQAIAAQEEQMLQDSSCAGQPIPPRYKTQYFNHMIGYSSRYFAYIWSEVYAADAFRHIAVESKYGADLPTMRRLGEVWRNEVLATGNTRDPEESYLAFRGKPATVDALLIRRGLMEDPLAVEKQ